jgi:stress-induced morphogen
LGALFGGEPISTSPKSALRRRLMPMAADELETRLRRAFPDATIEIHDLAGDGDHYRARIVSDSFRGVSRVRQHQMVYAALGGSMGGELHALALETSPPP